VDIQELSRRVTLSLALYDSPGKRSFEKTGGIWFVVDRTAFVSQSACGAVDTKRTAFNARIPRKPVLDPFYGHKKLGYLNFYALFMDSENSGNAFL